MEKVNLMLEKISNEYTDELADFNEKIKDFDE